MLQTVAWLVVGERSYRAVYIDYAATLQSAADHHGIWRDLCIADDVHEAIKAAYDQGRRDALYGLQQQAQRGNGRQQT